MMNFQNPLVQNLVGLKPLQPALQEQQATNALLVKLIIQNKLLAMKNAALQNPRLYKYSEQPEKRVKADTVNINLYSHGNDNLSQTFDDSVSTASHMSPMRSPILTIPKVQRQTVVKQGFKPIQPQLQVNHKMTQPLSVQMQEVQQHKEIHI